MSGVPEVGNQLNFHIDFAPPNALSVLHLGVSKRQFMGILLPYDLGPLGAPGCQVLVGPEATFLQTVGGSGSWIRAVLVPNNPLFIGLNLHSQFFAVDTTANALGVVGSNAMTTVLGGYY